MHTRSTDPPTAPAPTPPGRSSLALVALGALGVVYGDIGTSPLYALRECFHGEFAVAPTHDNVLGVLSLMFWSLVLVVSIKYLVFVLRADNDGEGGVIALTSLLLARQRRIAGGAVLVVLGLFASALLYGDGMITPAISVLSAVEGLGIITPRLTAFVLPLAVGILIGLFALQRHGTHRVGSLFGPIILLWFLVIGAWGVSGIAHYPGVLQALSPTHGARFLIHNGGHGFLVLGAVFLVVTGSEAIYADMGHFGAGPIRLAWFAVVLPGVLLNYFGQGALILHDPAAAHHPFYALVSPWARVPMVLLATIATVIASQAVISGAFSLTRQAIQLGFLPRMKVVHTSSDRIGQIYIPAINWLLLAATVALVLGFRSSSGLAAAYGVAVTSTMLITSVLFYVVARDRWSWSRLGAGSIVAVFLIVDIAFFGANIAKIAHGAWFPLLIGLVFLILLTTWKRGRAVLAHRMSDHLITLETLLERLKANPPRRVPGQAIFLVGNPEVAPPALLHNLEHNKVLHDSVALLTVVTETVPRVDPGRRVEITDLGQGLVRITARFGYMQEPDVPEVLRAAGELGYATNLDEASFFLGREQPLVGKRPAMARWRERLFALMSRNARDATSFFHIPPDRVVELGEQVEL